jgi:hypothetical protein
MRVSTAERERLDRMAKQRGLGTAAELVRFLIAEEERRGKFLRGLARGKKADERAAGIKRAKVIPLRVGKKL